LSFLLPDPALPVFYTLSLHDALPIYIGCNARPAASFRNLGAAGRVERLTFPQMQEIPMALSETHVLMIATDGFEESELMKPRQADRKSTRLNSSHVKISYAVFCLKKK